MRPSNEGIEESVALGEGVEIGEGVETGFVLLTVLLADGFSTFVGGGEQAAIATDTLIKVNAIVALRVQLFPDISEFPLFFY